MVVDFSISIDNSLKYPSLIVRGEIDVHTCPQLQQALQALTDEKNQDLILNLTDTHYIDSTGLGTIAHTARKIDETNHVVYVVCDKLQIKKIFEVSGLLSKNIKLFEHLSEIDE